MKGDSGDEENKEVRAVGYWRRQAWFDRGELPGRIADAEGERGAKFIRKVKTKSDAKQLDEVMDSVQLSQFSEEREKLKAGERGS